MKNKGFSVSRPFYTLASTDGVTAELTLYGDIVEVQPTDWWGDPIEGNFIIQDEFLADLETIKGCTFLNIRINSMGGDAAVAIMIHNRLRELARGGMKISCVVDGVAMSGGSLIMCACDTVRVYPSSIVMIHKCWTFFCGGFNADELRNAATRQDAIDKAQAGIYTQKTGLSETQILHMMSDTTYMTGREAFDKKFADEILDAEDSAPIAASADGKTLFVRGRVMKLAPGLFAPDWIPTAKGEEKAIDGESPEEIDGQEEMGENSGPETLPEEPGENEEGGQNMTLEELRVQYPEIAQQIDEEREAAARAATEAERNRLREIDEIASTVGDAAILAEARYGETACDARELSFRAARAMAKTGNSFLAAMRNDAAGANAVGAVPAPAEEKTADSKGGPKTMDEARAETKALLHPGA